MTHPEIEWAWLQNQKARKEPKKDNIIKKVIKRVKHCKVKLPLQNNTAVLK